MRRRSGAPPAGSGFEHASHHRTRCPAEGARPCPKRRRTAEHDPDPFQRPDRGTRRRGDLRGHRSRHRDRRRRGGRGRTRRRDHRARPHALRDRAQTARRRSGPSRSQRRRQSRHRDGRAVALPIARAAGERLSRHVDRRLRGAPHDRAQGSGPPDRPHAFRDLHRGDAVLFERRLSARRAGRGRAGAAGGRDGRSPLGAGRSRAARSRRFDAGRDRAAQDGR